MRIIKPLYENKKGWSEEDRSIVHNQILNFIYSTPHYLQMKFMQLKQLVHVT